MEPNIREAIKLLALHKRGLIPSQLPLEHGGSIDGFNQYNTGSHGTGTDSPIDENGNVNPSNPQATVQNQENSFKGYVFSDVLINPETGNQFNVDMAKIIKKNQKADLDEPTKNKVEFEAKRLSKLNDEAKSSVEAFEAAYGKKLKEMAAGGIIPAAMAEVIKRLYQKSLPTNPLKPLPLTPLEVPERELPASASHVFNTEAYSPEAKSPSTNTMVPALIGKGIELATKGVLSTIGDRTGENPVVNPNESRIIQEMADRRVDTSALNNRIYAGMRAAIINARETNRGAGVVNALSSNIYANTTQQLSENDIREQQVNTQLSGEFANTLNNLGQQRVQSENIANQIKAQNRAARADSVQGLAESIGNTGAFLTNLKNADISASEKLLLLKRAYPNFTVNADNLQEFINAILTGSDLTKFRGNA